MSIRIMTAVWATKLPDSEKIVLLALADCANDEGGCWPSMKTLAEKCSKTDRTVQAAIKALCSAGHLTRNEVRGKGCAYIVHPRSGFTPEVASPPKRLRPEAASPPKRTTLTPEAASDKPSRTTIPQKASPSSARAPAAQSFCRLPGDWTPTRTLPASTQSKVDQWPPGKLADELAALHRWAANASNDKGKGRKLDWDAAWVNWLERANEDWKTRNGSRNRTNRLGRDDGVGPTTASARDFLAAMGGA